MKRQIISVTIAISTIVLTALPGLTSTVKKVALCKIDSVKYQAVKLENSMDAMLNPEQGGIRPMPPPPRWIPPVEEGIMNKMPPNYLPKKPSHGNYTPIQHLPPSPAWIIPPIENEGEFIDVPDFTR